MYRSFTSIILLTVTVVLSSGCTTVGFMPMPIGLDIPLGVPVVGGSIPQHMLLEQEYIDEPTFKVDKVAPIKTIALLDIPNPPHYYLANFLTGFYGEKVEPTTHFLGGASEGSSATGKDSGFNFAVIAQRSLKTHLELKGYKVISVNVNREEQHKLLKNYSHLNIPDIDAYLDLAPTRVGFRWGPWGHAQDLSPYVAVAVRLVSSDSKEIIYEESVEYALYSGALPWFWEGIRLKAPPEHYFKNAKSVKKQKEVAKERLAQGIDAVLQAIVDRLSSVKKTPITH